MSAFKPKGDRAEWRMIFEDLLADADFGTVVTYSQLEETLGRAFDKDRGPLYRARQELGDLRHRWLEAVPTVGYRVIDAAEHVRVAAGHKRRGRRQFGQMIRVLQVTDLERLQATDLELFDEQQKVAFALWGVIAHESRIRRIEDVLRKEGLM